MNKSHVKGGWNETKGRAKEEFGHATGNSSKAAEGVGDRIKGKLHNAVGDAKDAIKKGVDRILGDKH